MQVCIKNIENMQKNKLPKNVQLGFKSKIVIKSITKRIHYNYTKYIFT